VWPHIFFDADRTQHYVCCSSTGLLDQRTKCSVQMRFQERYLNLLKGYNNNDYLLQPKLQNSLWRTCCDPSANNTISHFSFTRRLSYFCVYGIALFPSERMSSTSTMLFCFHSGIFFVLPCIDTYTKVDLRTVSFDVPPQEV